MTSGRGSIMTAALTVAAAAGVATAHGLYQVAAAARVPAPIAWLYPLITDGLALVAYAATARLHDRARRYAAGIVILAAGLSGLAQAVYLAGALDHAVAPTGLRFGVGAWPAIAAALTAHLLHLIVGEHSTLRPASKPASAPAMDTEASNADVQPRTTSASQTDAVQPAGRPSLNARTRRPGNRTARDRARAAAQRHHDDHGRLPTVSELARISGVARGTAGNALKDLRAERPALHIVNADTNDRTDQ
jgi:hypothetical protein